MSLFLCLLVCIDKLGVESGGIPDANFEASHKYNASYGPHKARLHGPSGWGVSTSISSPWIQVDIGYSTNVTGLLTQGSQAKQSYFWITKLKVSTFYAAANDSEVFIRDGNSGPPVVEVTIMTIVLKSRCIAFVAIEKNNKSKVFTLKIKLVLF